MDKQIVRIQDLIPGKKYKRLGFNHQLGSQIYTVDQKIEINPNHVSKLYRLNVGSENLLAATQYTEFVEVS